MKCDNPYNIKLTPEVAGKHGINYAPVSCGKCYNCKARRVQQWSFRLQKELEVSTSAYFITLTYNTLHVPITTGRYPMSLCKNSDQNKKLSDSEGRTDRSIQAFFKRLRYYERENAVIFSTKTKKVDVKKPLRYYACGEYGAKRKRPHYHIILFNLVSAQSVVCAWATAVVDKGITIDYIPFGEVHIDEDVNSNNIDYTLKYICKEGKAGTGYGDDRVPEFSLMSKGLGKNWITPEIETFYNRRLDISYLVNQSGVKVAIPKYYINKMMSEETKEDRIGYIKRGVGEAEAKDKTTEKQKQGAKIARQALMKNYSKRYKD